MFSLSEWILKFESANEVFALHKMNLLQGGGIIKGGNKVFCVVINKNSSILKFYKKISFVSFCSDIFRNYCRQFFIKFQSWVKEGKRREFNKKKLVHKVGKKFRT